MARMSTPNFDLKKLLLDVFAPSENETAVVLVDQPHDDLKDHDHWRERRVMAQEWRHGFESLGLTVLPLVEYEATGVHNADLPSTTVDGMDLAEVLAKAHIAVAMTEFSATAPLSTFAARSNGSLRVASMPGVLRRMEQSALSADYKEVARRVHILTGRLTAAISADITFTSGHHVQFDLRHRRARSDDGLCHRGTSNPLINLPSGEAFIVPYEGEIKDDHSQTAGRIPIQEEGETVILEVKNNRITGVQGSGEIALYLREYFDMDPARRNIAELGLGCNESAIVAGSVLEDEKAGMHWAYGRSEHLGGTVGPEAFLKPEYVVHRDIVYARDCSIGITSLSLRYEDGTEEEIMRDGLYILF